MRTAAIVLLVSTGMLAATAAQTDTPSFEVASVKANASGDPGLLLDVLPGGRFIATNIPLSQLIRAAYTLQLFQIVDAPAWVRVERFDINARADRDITVTTPWIPGARFALVQLMLQSLLAERFKLVARFDTRELPTYALVEARPNGPLGAKLRPAAEDCASSCGMRIGAGTLAARKVPLPQLAEFLSQVTGRLVVDRTGLSGAFDLDLAWVPEQAQAPTPAGQDGVSIFTAVQEQLGLKLDATRAPVPVLVIEHIDRPSPD